MIRTPISGILVRGKENTWYTTFICLCELEIIGKELLQKYSITVCYNAVHTSTAFLKKALIDKCLFL